MIDDFQKKYLFDILKSLDAIDEHLEYRKIFSEFLNSNTKKRAIEREFEIIGEAMSKLNKLNENIPITNKRLIIDLRNRVIHSYDSVDEEQIWKIIIKDVPILKNEVKNLLNS